MPPIGGNHSGAQQNADCEVGNQLENRMPAEQKLQRAAAVEKWDRQEVKQRQHGARAAEERMLDQNGNDR